MCKMSFRVYGHFSFIDIVSEVPYIFMFIFFGYLLHGLLVSNKKIAWIILFSFLGCILHYRMRFFISLEKESKITLFLFYIRIFISPWFALIGYKIRAILFKSKTT